MGRNVLVVEAVEHSEAAVRSRLGDDVDEVRVVVPVVRQGFLDWIANDERAASEAEDEAARLADELPQVVDAGKGEADVMLAIRDALEVDRSACRVIRNGLIDVRTRTPRKY